MYNIVVQVIYAKFKIKLHMQNPQHAQVYKIVDQVTYAKFRSSCKDKIVDQAAYANF